MNLSESLLLECPWCRSCADCIGVKEAAATKIDLLTTIVEIVMTQHWDMIACPCWICRLGREADCHPREEHLRWRGTYAFTKMEDR